MLELQAILKKRCNLRCFQKLSSTLSDLIVDPYAITRSFQQTQVRHTRYRPGTLCRKESEPEIRYAVRRNQLLKLFIQFIGRCVAVRNQPQNETKRKSLGGHVTLDMVRQIRNLRFRESVGMSPSLIQDRILKTRELPCWTSQYDGWTIFETHRSQKFIFMQETRGTIVLRD